MGGFDIRRQLHLLQGDEGRKSLQGAIGKAAKNKNRAAFLSRDRKKTNSPIRIEGDKVGPLRKGLGRQWRENFRRGNPDI